MPFLPAPRTVEWAGLGVQHSSHSPYRPQSWHDSGFCALQIKILLKFCYLNFKNELFSTESSVCALDSLCFLVDVNTKTRLWGIKPGLFSGSKVLDTTLMLQMCSNHGSSGNGPVTATRAHCTWVLSRRACRGACVQAASVTGARAVVPVGLLASLQRPPRVVRAEAEPPAAALPAAPAQDKAAASET